MNNVTTTALQGQQLLSSRLELVTPTTVAGTLYGVALTLFCLYVHSIVPRLQNANTKRQAKVMLGFNIVIMLCGLYNLVSAAWATQEAYIKHSDYDGGPEQYILTSYRTGLVFLMSGASQVAVDVLTSMLQIWRVWTVWSATRYANLVIVSPILCFLTAVGLKLRTIVLDHTLSNAQLISVDSKTALLETAFQGATTILCTTLISTILIFMRWRQKKLNAQGSTGYLNIVAIMVESYALESIWLFAIIVFSGHGVLVFFAESAFYIEIIACLFLQCRVASGRAYESQRNQRNISSLRWNHSINNTMQSEETHDGTHVSEFLEAPDISQASSMV